MATGSGLAGRCVAVTGGASGIGAAIVRRFHEEGARVAVLDIAEAEGRALCADLGAGPGCARFYPQDMTRLKDLPALFRRIGADLGGLNVLVNNAAWDHRFDFDTLTPEDWQASLDINLAPAVFAAQAAVPLMREAGGGAIVNLTSIAWKNGHPDLVPYAAAKAGVVGVVRSLGRKLGPDRIRVNGVAPGLVMTERQARLWHTPQTEAQTIARQAIPEPVPAEAIADAVAFLASDRARYVTRQVLRVDGGLL
jgi:NAD(P)-dependent dehydrogenase (short-subunit alcohol dehydrogenase family)